MMAGRAREHAAQVAEQFRPSTDDAADSRNPWPLAESQCGGDVQHFVHLRFRHLGCPMACIDGQGFQIPAQALGVQYAQRLRGFTGTRYAANIYDLAQRHIYINILGGVDP